MEADYTIRCDGGSDGTTYYAMKALAVLGLLVYPIGIPCLVGATLYQHRREWRTSYAQLKHRHETAMGRAQKEIRGRELKHLQILKFRILAFVTS